MCSSALRVDELDGALETLASVGNPTVYREEGLADADPAAPVGLPIQWTT